jgi:hypothetical protein
LKSVETITIGWAALSAIAFSRMLWATPCIIQAVEWSPAPWLM